MALSGAPVVSTGTAWPGAYEPDEDWLLEWLAALEEEIAGTPAWQTVAPILGVTLIAGTDIGAVQANWWLHRSLPDLGCGQRYWR